MEKVILTGEKPIYPIMQIGSDESADEVLTFIRHKDVDGKVYEYCFRTRSIDGWDWIVNFTHRAAKNIIDKFNPNEEHFGENDWKLVTNK